MKHLIVDFLNRWKWRILLLFGLCVLFNFMFPSVSEVVFFAFLVSPLCVFFVYSDFRRGYLDTLRRLPVSRNQLALALWGTAVVLFPALGALLLLPSCVLMLLIRPGFHVSMNHLLVSFFMSIALSGILLLLLSLTPEVGRAKEKRRLWVADLWGVIPGVVGVIWLDLLDMTPLQPSQAVVIAVGLLCVPFSFFTFRHLLTHPAERFSLPAWMASNRSPSVEISFTRNRLFPEHSLAAFWIRRFLIHLAVFLSVLVCFCLYPVLRALWTGDIWITGQIDNHMAEAFEEGAGVFLVFFAAFVAMFGGLGTVAGNLRLLRSLPISTERLALWLLSLPLSGVAGLLAALLVSAPFCGIPASIFVFLLLCLPFTVGLFWIGWDMVLEGDTGFVYVLALVLIALSFILTKTTGWHKLIFPELLIVFLVGLGLCILGGVWFHGLILSGQGIYRDQR
jgi:hypothetical protein